MTKFAKLFDFGDGQILFRLGYNEESEEHNYTIIVEIQDEEITYESSVGFKTQEKRNKQWSEINETYATKIFDHMVKTYNIS